MSFSELLFLSIVALLVFGPRKLPEIARVLGKTMAELRRAANEFRYSLEEEVRNLELQEQLKGEQSRLPAAPTSADAQKASDSARESWRPEHESRAETEPGRSDDEPWRSDSEALSAEHPAESSSSAADSDQSYGERWQSPPADATRQPHSGDAEPPAHSVPRGSAVDQYADSTESDHIAGANGGAALVSGQFPSSDPWRSRERKW